MRGFSRVGITVSADAIEGRGSDTVLVTSGSRSMEMASLDVVLNLMPEGSDVLLCATGTVSNGTVHRLSRIIAACRPFVAVDLSAVTELSRVSDHPFRRNPKLHSIRFPHNLSSINPKAFAFCPALVSVEIPPSVETVGKRAFLGCRSLASLAFARPDGWTYDAPSSRSVPAEALEDPASVPPKFTEEDGAYSHVTLRRAAACKKL